MLTLPSSVLKLRDSFSLLNASHIQQHWMSRQKQAPGSGCPVTGRLLLIPALRPDFPALFELGNENRTQSAAHVARKEVMRNAY
jgi:hypothetical protein